MVARRERPGGQGGNATGKCARPELDGSISQEVDRARRLAKTHDILERKPEIQKAMVQLRSGYGMPGGPANPLGARALYLWQGKTDTLYRIHGTNEPESVGHDVSAGCIRMRNEDVVDLYERTPVGTRVVVLAGHSV